MQLRLAPQAGGTDHRARRQVIKRRMAIGDEGIERHFARPDGDQRELGLHDHRHILHGMHGKIRRTIHQRGFQFLDEEPLAAHLGQRAIENLVAPGGHSQ